MKFMQTNSYGLFNSPMLSKSIASAYFDTKKKKKNTAKNIKRIIPMLSFTTEETKKIHK
jgi:hypothetical protein